MAMGQAGLGPYEDGLGWTRPRKVGPYRPLLGSTYVLSLVPKIGDLE